MWNICAMAYRRSQLMQTRLAENRARIVLATRRLIAVGGFRTTSMTAVAKEAGLSTGALYSYFPSKATLFVEVLTNAVTHEVAILRSIIERPGSAVVKLQAAVSSFATRALAGPNLAYAFIAEPTETEVEAARLVCRQQFSEVFKDVLRQGIEAAEFPPQSVQISAACIVGAFTEALIRPITPLAPVAKPADGEKLIEASVEFCVRAAGAGREPVDYCTLQKQ
jgi:AcrR family transcriptional regulator